MKYKYVKNILHLWTFPHPPGPISRIVRLLFSEICSFIMEIVREVYSLRRNRTEKVTSIKLKH